MGVGDRAAFLSASLAANVLLVAFVLWMAAPSPSAGEASEADGEPPIRGEIQLFTIEYFLHPDVEPSARNSFDEGFFRTSDLHERPFVPSGRTNDQMVANGSCVIVQTHIQLPEPLWLSSYEEAVCLPGDHVIVETEDYFGTRIGVLFSSDASHAKISGDAYILPYPEGRANSFESFTGTMSLMYVVPRQTEEGVVHDDLRYDMVPFTGEVHLEYHGLVEWQRGSLD